jgi:hypothetical protein
MPKITATANETPAAMGEGFSLNRPKSKSAAPSWREGRFFNANDADKNLKSGKD